MTDKSRHSSGSLLSRATGGSLQLADDAAPLARVSLLMQPRASIQEAEDAEDARYGVTTTSQALTAYHSQLAQLQDEFHSQHASVHDDDSPMQQALDVEPNGTGPQDVECPEACMEEGSHAGEHLPAAARTAAKGGAAQGTRTVQFDAPAKRPSLGGPHNGMHHTARPMRPRKRGDKKAPVMKTWLRIDSSGTSTVLHADKYKLTQKLGIQTRDLRLLDPQLSTTYPSAILCRDKSIVVNLEHIKAIITRDAVMVVNHEERSTVKFIEELKQRLAHPGLSHSKSCGDLQRAAGPGGGSVGNGLSGLAHGLGSTNALASAAGGLAVAAGLASELSAQLPFELRALEVCLDELASAYDLLTTELEATAYPALDALAARVTSPHLERVRRIKNRLVRLTTRVETVREVLEKFLDDDEDMHDLNLTANQERDEERLELDLDAPLTVPEDAHGLTHQRLQHHVSQLSVKSLASSCSTDSSVMEDEVAEVEMLLEAYFMAFDNTFNRLNTLNEYIKDTEDLVNIKLDQHRNQLITTDLILTALTCSMAMVTTISGIFGMNLDSELQQAPGVFLQVTVASCVGAFGLFVGFLVWAWRFGLLVFN